MPLYAYKCESCGFSKDALQKISDAPLTVCPACGADAFRKQVTAAGFQLKGSGWYVTDFRDGGKSSGGKAGGEGKPAEAAKPEGGSQEAAPAAKADAPAAAPAPAPATPPAPSSGS